MYKDKHHTNMLAHTRLYDDLGVTGNYIHIYTDSKVQTSAEMVGNISDNLIGARVYLMFSNITR
jgi:cephalosporin hydroxylase